MNIVKKIGVLCLSWFAVACSTIPVYEPVRRTPPVREPAPVYETAPVYESDLPSYTPEPIIKPEVKPESAPVDDAAKAPAAVLSLLNRAQQQEQNGDQQAAVASLERAIRIAPRYPESYFRLGELRYKQGYYEQARSLGQKALSLGAGWWLRRQAESLVERASAAQ